mmetsp:Transcript_28416/g.25150  ORF Transcript_28416/g.25150 Transcript_28416/m.25150 type:complete len:114 (+) Transcript_28416:476-817(+)
MFDSKHSFNKKINFNTQDKLKESFKSPVNYNFQNRSFDKRNSLGNTRPSSEDKPKLNFNKRRNTRNIREAYNPNRYQPLLHNNNILKERSKNVVKNLNVQQYSPPSSVKKDCL